MHLLGDRFREVVRLRVLVEQNQRKSFLLKNTDEDLTLGSRLRPAPFAVRKMMLEHIIFLAGASFF